MRKFRHMMKMAALVLTGAIISACSDEDNAVDHPANGARTYTVTTTLTIDGGAETRALDGSTGVKTFAPGDKIAVKYYKTGRAWDYETTISNELKSTDITEDGKKASFTVTLDNPDPGKTEVRYVYPAYMESDEGRAHILESEQDGTLASLTTKFDYAEASGTIVHSGGDITLPTGLTLSNQLALAKFTFSDGTSDITASLKRLIIEDGTHTYLVTPKGTSDIWVAMYPVTTAQTITMTATDDAQYYEKSVTGKTLAKNNLYPISVTMPAATSDRTVPLTLEAKENDVVVKFKLSSFLTNPVEYRTYASGTWSAWAEYTSEDEITLATTGDKVNFRGTNSNYCDHYLEASTIFCTDDCYLYGNMMSLVDATAFPVLKKLTEDHTFHNLFSGNEHVYSHDTRPILLPATKLSACCYQGLFEGCNNLTVAPELPATELAGHCYEAMFNGCSSLEHGPLLPATELEDNCYSVMFQYCSNLKSVICLATEYLDNTYWMLKGAGKKDDPKPILYIAPGAVWTIDDVGDCEDGEDGIPNYWIVKDYNAH